MNRRTFMGAVAASWAALVGIPACEATPSPDNADDIFKLMDGRPYSLIPPPSKQSLIPFQYSYTEGIPVATSRKFRIFNPRSDFRGTVTEIGLECFNGTASSDMTDWQKFNIYVRLQLNGITIPHFLTDPIAPLFPGDYFRLNSWPMKTPHHMDIPIVVNDDLTLDVYNGNAVIAQMQIKIFGHRE